MSSVLTEILKNVKFLHNGNADATKAIAIRRVFSENSGDKNITLNQLTFYQIIPYSKHNL